MKIENNMLYRDHYDPEPVATLLYPGPDIYNDTTASLNPEQEEKLKIERAILTNFISLPTVKSFFRLKENIVLPIAQHIELHEKLMNEMKENNLPMNLLNSVFSTNDDGYPRVYMLPNKHFPITSILALKNAKGVCIYQSAHSENDTEGFLNQRRCELVDRYEHKILELKDCKDQDFVEKQLSPFRQKIADFDEKNKDIVKSINEKEILFNQYVENLGLKEDFEKYENTQHLKLENKPKKNKMK